MDRSFLLRTKFLVPQRGGDLLPRPHLLARLKSAVSSKRLTLFSAPPGYGKTTLLAELASDTELPCAWYQLDAADGDPTIFLSCLIACFRQIVQILSPDRGVSLGNAASSLLDVVEPDAFMSFESVLTVLINDVTAAITGNWFIILEDYYLVTNPDIHNLVNALLEKSPPGLHLVISSRTDPPLRLARLRAQGLLAEFRSPDLRFGQEEVEQWLERAIPDLDKESAKLLSERTEGWAAALQIVLSSLAGKDAESASRFIADLSGTQRFIFQYLADEVFQQQSVERQQFLMYTAILDQMNAAACNALLGTENAQLMLDSLEQDNLLVVSLDEKRDWYRYHHLFRGFLLAKLRREAPGSVAELEASAGLYYERQAEVEAAFAHYLRSRDYAAAARVLSQFAGEYVERGRVAVLHRYLSELPKEWVQRHPELLMHQGDVMWRLGQVGSAVARYEDAQAACAAAGDDEGVGRVLTQMSRLARSQGNYRRARDRAEEALNHISADAYASQANALMALAKGEGFLTSMDRGRALAEESVAAARQAGMAMAPRTRADLLRSLGQICWWYGDPQATLRYCQEALDSVVDKRSPIAARIYITMATPYVYRRDLDTAQKYAELGLEIAQQLQLSAVLTGAYSTLGSILTRRRDWARAETLLRRALDLSQGLGLDAYIRIMATGYLAQNLCAQGRIDEARQLAEGALWEHPSNQDTYEMVVCRSVLADVLLESDQLDEAQAIFESLVEIAQRRQFRVPLAMIHFGLAYIHLRNGRRAQAIEFACHSIDILEPLGTWQLYLDQGERARLVCQAMVAADRSTPFVNEVLRRLLGTTRLAVAEPDSVFRVRCLGPFRVLVRGEEISQEQWVSTKARDLLAFFVHFRGQRIPIERATEAIWPENPRHSRAYHSALYRLRQALRCQGDDDAKYILVKGGEYWLDTSRFRIDVDAFEAALSAAQKAQESQASHFYGRAVALYHDEYLSNLRYYDWPNHERQRLTNAYLMALRRLASHHTAQGDFHDAFNFIEQALQIDALSEESHRNAMRYYAAIGDEVGLVRQYQQLQQALHDELNVKPSYETQALYQRLLADAGPVQR